MLIIIVAVIIVFVCDCSCRYCFHVVSGTRMGFLGSQTSASAYAVTASSYRLLAMAVLPRALKWAFTQIDVEEKEAHTCKSVSNSCWHTARTHGSRIPRWVRIFSRGALAQPALAPRPSGLP